MEQLEHLLKVVNESSDNYIAYCFAEKKGYSNLEFTQEMEMQMVHLFIQDLNQHLYIF